LRERVCPLACFVFGVELSQPLRAGEFAVAVGVCYEAGMQSIRTQDGVVD